jgi:hypothetical protein
MSAVMAYKQCVYTEIDFNNTTLGSLTGALPQMFLTISGVAKVSSNRLEKSKSEGLHAFPNWKYHVVEFEQWINGNIQVYIASFSGS